MSFASLGSRAAWFVYQLLTAAVFFLLAPWFLLRRGLGWHQVRCWQIRLGLTPRSLPPSRRPIWLHAISVGEVAVARTLADRFDSTTPLLITTITLTGQAQAKRVFSDSNHTVTYLPIDIGFAVERFFENFRPRALILVEGDYWPLVLRATRPERHDLPVVVINGRVGDRSARRLERIPNINRRLFFSNIRAFAVQTEDDRVRLVRAGARAEVIRVVGNIKFDAPAPTPIAELESCLSKQADNRPILVAGSTMPGEEEAVLEALRLLAESSVSCLLILAPRHPERWDAAARLIDEAGFHMVRRTELSRDKTFDLVPEVILLDSLGELADTYRLAAAAFVGGTLSGTGGHNPIEPSRYGIATAVGPSMENFRDIARLFDSAGAWQRIDGPSSLAECWRCWLTDTDQAAQVGARAAALVEENRGALSRTLAAIAPFLGGEHFATTEAVGLEK